MPASASSPIAVLSAHTGPDDLEADADLLVALAGVPDPRKARGRRHRLVTVLAASVCAVLAGARSYVAIAEWAQDLPVTARLRLGVGRRMRGHHHHWGPSPTIKIAEPRAHLAAVVEGDIPGEQLGHSRPPLALLGTAAIASRCLDRVENQIQQPQRHGGDHARPLVAADHRWSAAGAAFWNPPQAGYCSPGT